MPWIDSPNGILFLGWQPRSRHLHYVQLYTGLYEHLRMCPDPAYRNATCRYLAELEQYPGSTLQQHRIQWTREWLAQLPPSGAIDVEISTIPDGP